MCDLKEAISAIVAISSRMDVEDFEDLLNAAGDDLETGERDEDLYLGAVIDGIRWGVRAGVCVELAGGAMLRIALPGGVRISHEWASEGDARATIDRALLRLADDAEAVGA